MPLQFHLASQTGQAQKRRLPGCRLGGGGRKLVREGYTGQEPRIRSPSQASDQPASAQLLHSPSFAESCAQSPVSAAERVVAGLPWRAPDSCSLQRDQVNKVAGERFLKCLEPICVLGGLGSREEESVHQGTELGVWGFL
jgi:hypothetical protein